MQTILGANGIIASELAKELHLKYTKEIRLVSRNPKRINDTDELFSADLLDGFQTANAVKGSEIVYLVVGLPYNSKIWQKEWPIVMRNVIDACKIHNAKLVFFDNVYMYGRVKGTMTEETPFNAVSIKGKVRGKITQMLLDEINSKQITATICRAPEFYGPLNTKSGTNSTIFYNIKKGKKLQALVNDSTLRTLIYAPDAARSTALIGNTQDAYNQTWHLPCDKNRLTSKQFIALCSTIKGEDLKYTIIKKWMIKMSGLFNPFIKEVVELIYQWEQDYIFDFSKFNNRFPDFETTSYKEGINEIISEYK
jgi:nucleoside-diphosphate-sugar epimerase